MARCLPPPTATRRVAAHRFGEYHMGGRSTCPHDSSRINRMSGFFWVMAILCWLVWVAIMIASSWAAFSKAGRPGWASIVPIYNVIVMLDIAGKPWWWVFLLFIPLVGI